MERLEKRKAPSPLIPLNGAVDNPFATTQILFKEVLAATFISQSNLYYSAMRGTKSALYKKAT